MFWGSGSVTDSEIDKIKDLVVYGAGTIATDIIKKTNFFKKIKNFDLIDSDLKKVGNTIANKRSNLQKF